jgi:hypothetical protein
MKQVICIVLILTSTQIAWGKDINVYSDDYIKNLQSDYKEKAINSEMEITNLSKTVAFLQRNYEEKINYLEIELAKTKSRLIEKSLNEEKIQASLKEKYEQEFYVIKKELASKTRTTLEMQRQIEKMNPTEDQKKLILINNELAAELRKSEGQLAVMQLELKKGNNFNNKITPFADTNARRPASVTTKPEEVK